MGWPSKLGHWIKNGQLLMGSCHVVAARKIQKWWISNQCVIDEDLRQVTCSTATCLRIPRPSEGSFSAAVATWDSYVPMIYIYLHIRIYYIYIILYIFTSKVVYETQISMKSWKVTREPWRRAAKRCRRWSKFGAILGLLPGMEREVVDVGGSGSRL